MKKLLISIMLALTASTMMLSFTSCSSPTKTDVSDMAVATGKKALSIADQYLDLDLDTETAYDQMCDLVKIEWDEYKDNVHIAAGVAMLRNSFSSWPENQSADETYDKVLEARNELAEYIGEETRD